MPYVEPRFERRGGPPDLPAAFAGFVTTVLGGRSLDESFNAESAEGEFPDFSLYRDLVLIEMKHLESEQKDRVQAVLDEKIAEEEMPIFYGKRIINVSNENFRNSDEILRSILTKLNRSIESALRKANHQFRSYRARHPRKNTINICVILNSIVAEYTPKIVSHAIHSRMNSIKEPQRFEKIDAVLYISEKHFTFLPEGGSAYPILVYEGIELIENGWKGELLNGITNSWATHRTGMPTEVAENMRVFASVEDIPETMSRSDAWQLEYKRDPYLRHLTLAELRVEFQRSVALNALTFFKGSWPKPHRHVTEGGLRLFQHLNAEINRRGVDMREMGAEKLTEDERRIVFSGLPMELVNSCLMVTRKILKSAIY